MNEFDRVVGYESIKTELGRIVDMMKNPDAYRKLGVKTTRGLLLVGDPGVGKTLMANCLIDASGRKAYTIHKDAPDGEFVKEIVNVFKEAKDNAPSILYLDDCDKYSNEDMMHPNSEEFVVIQSSIDDLKDSDVFVLATANDIECLPDSLLRPGRFDKTIYVKPPTGKDAELICEYYLKDKKISDDVSPKEVARLLDGRSCAALETCINEAGVYAGYERRELINMEDLVRSFMRVVYDAPESMDIRDSKIIESTAVHESGHTVVSEILEPESVNVVSVKSHDSDIGGFTAYFNNENYFALKKLMENRVVSLLAGKAAIELVYGTVDVGACDDIKRAYRVVSRFVEDYCAFGFGLGDMNRIIDSPDSIEERKAQVIQSEMDRYYQKAKEILAENRNFLDRITNELIKKETIYFRDIQNIRKECIAA